MALWASPPQAEAPAIPPTNVMVVPPCTGQNAEVQQAYDALRDLLYETWIGCGAGIGFSRSLDGGRTFEPAYSVPGSVGPGARSYSWDPAIALAPNGTVFVAFVHYNSTAPATNSTIVAWSTDGGASFRGWAYIAPPSSVRFYDRVFLAAGPNGTLYATWDLAPNGSMVHYTCPPGPSCFFTAGDLNAVIASSSDGGRTWSSPEPLSPDFPNGGADSAPVVVEPGGSVDVLYQRMSVLNATTDQLGPANLYFVRSPDGATNWTPPVQIPGPSLPSTLTWIDGALSLDTSGSLYVGFDAPGAGGVDHRYLAVSVDHGQSWATTDLGGPRVGSAVEPMVTPIAAANGTVDIAWMSNDSTGQGWTTYLQQFSANNDSFSQPYRASTQVGASGSWIGDTLGLTYLGGDDVAVSWTFATPAYAENCGTTLLPIICEPPEVWESTTAPFPRFAVTFREHQLPDGASWSVKLAGATMTNETVAEGTVSAGSLELPLPNGTFNFSIGPPSGFGVSVVTGRGLVNQTSGVVAGGAVWDVRFGRLEAVRFNESNLTGLSAFPGATWSVTLSGAIVHGGPAPELRSTNLTSIGFLVPTGARYKFTVQTPGPEYRALPAAGTFQVPGHSWTKIVRFKLLAEKIVFREAGLPSGTNWTVTLTNGSTPAVSFPLDGTRSAGAGAIVFFLPLGTYQYNVTAADGQPPGPGSGTVTVSSAPSPAQVVTITFG